MYQFEVARTVDLPELSPERITQLFEAVEQVIAPEESIDYSIALVDNDTIARLNEQYRDKQGPTDVLSFRYTQTTAEIVISTPKTRAQAEEYGNSVEEEAAFLLVHGILHVLGWDHERSEEEAQEMRSYEIDILSLCGLKCAR